MRPESCGDDLKARDVMRVVSIPGRRSCINPLSMKHRPHSIGTGYSPSIPYLLVLVDGREKP